MVPPSIVHLQKLCGVHTYLQVDERIDAAAAEAEEMAEDLQAIISEVVTLAESAAAVQHRSDLLADASRSRDAMLAG